MSEGGFDRLNQLEALKIIAGRDEEELLAKLRQIRLPTRIVSIYAAGTKHFAAILTDAKIVEKIVEKKKEKK